MACGCSKGKAADARNAERAVRVQERRAQIEKARAELKSKAQVQDRPSLSRR